MGKRKKHLLCAAICTAMTGCLLVAQHMGFWIFGAAAAAVGFCLLAMLASPRCEEEPAYSSGGNQLPPTPPRKEELPADDPPSSDSTNPADKLVEEMLAHRRFALLLRPQIAASLQGDHQQRAHAALEKWMALMAAGPVRMRSCRSAGDDEHDGLAAVERLLPVEAYYIDRYPVTNREYQLFVEHGGYEQQDLWDPAIWSSVGELVDRSSRLGPRFWNEGACEEGQEHHPVVGVSWFEADAYARWAGKRLLTDPEWVRAASTPIVTSGDKLNQRKYPWGEVMDHQRANIWRYQIGTTAAVNDFADGATPGGVRQMVGNVWEWTTTDFGVWEAQFLKLETDVPLKSIRGGAFDTYFDVQSAVDFQSGENPQARKHNIGFRCCLCARDLVEPQEPVRSGSSIPVAGWSPPIMMQEEVAG